MNARFVQQPLASYELMQPLRPSLATGAALLLARHATWHEPVVLKLLPLQRRSPETRWFEHEIQVMQALAPHNQGHWLSLLDHGQDLFLFKGKRQPVNYLVLPYYAAGSLAHLIQHHPEGLLARGVRPGQLCLHLLDAVAALHQCGWLHLDIKPGNFLLAQAGLTGVVLSDFALAQPLIASNTERGFATRGTPKYMSPEQFLGRPFSMQTDFYGLGLVFYELLCGYAAYSARSYHEWALQHCQQEIPLLPPALMALQPLIDGLLAKQPEHRFGSAAAVRQAMLQGFDQLQPA